MAVEHEPSPEPPEVPPVEGESVSIIVSALGVPEPDESFAPY